MTGLRGFEARNDEMRGADEDREEGREEDAEQPRYLKVPGLTSTLYGLEPRGEKRYVRNRNGAGNHPGCRT